MRIVALIAVRNEELTLERCLRHLIGQGVEICLIDNGSTDRTLDIAHSLARDGVFRIEHLPFDGTFELAKQCALQEQLSGEIVADWFLRQDADEIRHSDNWPAQTLSNAVADIDAQGCNAIGFDEFVFVPTSDDGDFEATDFVAEMNHYYYYVPFPNHRVNMWKRRRGTPVDLVSSGGHTVNFAGRRIADRALSMRHYIVLGAAHAARKYGPARVYSAAEMDQLGWHRARNTWRHMRFRAPHPSEMKRLVPGEKFDKSDPKRKHIFWSDAAP